MKCVHAGCIQDPCYDDAAWHMQLKKEINNMNSNTPTPWTQDGLSIVSEHWSDIAIIDNGATDMDANVIPQDEAYANAAFIVRAVNSHFELLAACKYALENGTFKAYTKDQAIFEKLELAISKAEGRI